MVEASALEDDALRLEDPFHVKASRHSAEGVPSGLCVTGILRECNVGKSARGLGRVGLVSQKGGRQEIRD